MAVALVVMTAGWFVFGGKTGDDQAALRQGSLIAEALEEPSVEPTTVQATEPAPAAVEAAAESASNAADTRGANVPGPVRDFVPGWVNASVGQGQPLGATSTVPQTQDDTALASNTTFNDTGNPAATTVPVPTQEPVSQPTVAPTPIPPTPVPATPVPTATAAPLPTATPVPPAPPPAGGPTAEQWAALRNCESGGNYSITNPNGLYRGAYQFSVSTWNWLAGQHYPELVGVDPAQAAAADQDKMALKLYEVGGWTHWPICGQYLL